MKENFIPVSCLDSDPKISMVINSRERAGKIPAFLTIKIGTIAMPFCTVINYSINIALQVWP